MEKKRKKKRGEITTGELPSFERGGRTAIQLPF